MNDNKFEILMENEYNKIITEYKSALLMESLCKNEYTYSIYMNNSNNADYFFETTEKVEEKKDSAIKRLIEWFKKFFRAIKEKILKLLGMKSEKVQIYDKLPAIEKGLKGFLQKVKDAITKLKDSKFADLLKTVLVTQAIILGITNIPRVAAWHYITTDNVKANGLINGVSKTLHELEDAIGIIPKKDNGNNGFSLLNFLKDIVTNLSKIITWGYKPLGNIADRVMFDYKGNLV